MSHNHDCGSCQGHAEHSHGKTEEAHYLSLATISFLLFAIEVATGLIAKSLSLLADSGHVLVDLAENIWSAYIARKANGNKNGLRWRKMGATVSALLLILVAAMTFYEAMLWEHKDENLFGFALFASVVGLIFNLWQLKKHKHAGESFRNLTHILQEYHLLGDAGSSVVATISNSLVFFFNVGGADVVGAIIIGSSMSVMAVYRLSRIWVWPDVHAIDHSH